MLGGISAVTSQSRPAGTVPSASSEMAGIELKIYFFVLTFFAEETSGTISCFKD